MTPTVPSRGYIAKSGRSDWRTPRTILDPLADLWSQGPDLDPCAAIDPAHHFARRNIAPPEDGLSVPWEGRTFVNPPFNGLRKWAAKCAYERSLRSCEVVLLMPSRTDTRAWHESVSTAAAICLLRGRLIFEGATDGAPFPCALVYWGSSPWTFARVFAPLGMVVCP